MSDITTNSSSNIVKVSEIGMAFGREYYTVLSREPSRLHLFYAKNSTLLHADEGDLDTPISIGSEAIQNVANKNSFLGARFIIGSIDCHPSQNGGILVNVLGQIQKRGQSSSSRHFMQTFFLAEQPSGYFILNDNLRFLERPDSNASSVIAPTINSAEPTPVSSVPVAVAAPIVETVVAPLEVAPVVSETVIPSTEIVTPVSETSAPTPARVKKITTAASKQKSSSSNSSVNSPVSTATAPAEVEVTSSPSSWAQLAAVQQNKWATGVVSLNKGTSIPSEEKPKIISSMSNNNNNNRKKPADQVNNNSNSNITSSPNISNSINNNTRRTDLSDGVKPTRLPFVPEASLYITGVTDNMKNEVIRAEFAALGDLAHFDVKYNSGAAFVEYADPAIAKILLEEGGIVVNGTRLTVEKRRIASRNNNFTGHRDNSNSNSITKDTDAASKKFTPTKSNRRERPANKTTPAPTTA